MANLIIVESKTKCGTIAKYVSKAFPDSSWVVQASFGHIQDLPAKQLGYNEETWDAVYVPQPSKAKTVTGLIRAAIKANKVYLASDPDREGEAIAAHLFHKFDAAGVPKDRMMRVRFHEITHKAIVEAIQNPGQIDWDMVEAQEGRRILDRMVGYKVSPHLWRRFPERGLSAGRVQSATLFMVSQPYKEAENYNPDQHEEYILESEMDVFERSWKCRSPASQTIPKSIANPPLLSTLCNPTHWSCTMVHSLRDQNPPPPFTTSSLQQEAMGKLKLPIKQTMGIAQDLYEHGLITYMRTDSTHLSGQALSMIHKTIEEKYGKDMIKSRNFKSKAAHAQEAHEAIRPTNTSSMSIPANSKLTDRHKALYVLIWKRTVASQMVAATFDVLTLTCEHESGYTLEGEQSTCKTPGYLQVYGTEPSSSTQPDSSKLTGSCIPKSLSLVTRHKSIPSLYTEGSLVKAMEVSGIGRPSTYAATLEKMFQKGYMELAIYPKRTIQTTSYTIYPSDLQRGVQEKITEHSFFGEKRLLPTSLGLSVCAFVQDNFPYLCSTEFTSQMEDKLDHIADKLLTKPALCEEMWKTLQTSIKALPKITEKVEKAKPSSENYELVDGSKVVVRETRYGPCIQKEQTYINLKPYLQKVKKSMNQLSQNEVAFLASLPQPWSTDSQLCYGRYGFYTKAEDGTTNTIKAAEWKQVQKQFQLL